MLPKKNTPISEEQNTEETQQPVSPADKKYLQDPDSLWETNDGEGADGLDDADDLEDDLREK